MKYFILFPLLKYTQQINFHFKKIFKLIHKYLRIIIKGNLINLVYRNFLMGWVSVPLSRTLLHAGKMLSLTNIIETTLYPPASIAGHASRNLSCLLCEARINFFTHTHLFCNLQNTNLVPSVYLV